MPPDPANCSAVAYSMEILSRDGVAVRPRDRQEPDDVSPRH